jgi:hypothetical protein
MTGPDTTVLLRVETAGGVVVLTGRHLILEGYAGGTRRIACSDIASAQAKPLVWPRVGVAGSKLVVVHDVGGERYELGSFPWEQADRLLVLLGSSLVGLPMPPGRDRAYLAVGIGGPTWRGGADEG